MAAVSDDGSLLSDASDELVKHLLEQKCDQERSEQAPHHVALLEHQVENEF